MQVALIAALVFFIFVYIKINQIIQRKQKEFEQYAAEYERRRVKILIESAFILNSNFDELNEILDNNKIQHTHDNGN